jgi:putative transposase
MIDRKKELSVKRQCELLSMPRSTAYYKPAEVSAADLKLMRRIDELHMEFVYAGSRKLCILLKREGYKVGRRHVRTLMIRMGIEALYPKPNTSRRREGSQIYPYLLRNLEIRHSNHVWAADITYIPLNRGFAYLFAVMDWYSRRVLSWRLSNTLTADFCVEAVKEAFERYGKPEIFNTDQGSQFTSEEFVGLLKQSGVRISMDGKGSWRDNVFIERLWRSVKYEEVYLHAYNSVSEARMKLKGYFCCYNEKRPHQSLDNRTPDEVYCEGFEQRAA